MAEKEKKEAKPEAEKELEEQIAGKVLLVPADKYLKSGAHIGTKFKSGEMKKYIYKKRPDGLSVLDVQTLDERIRIAAQTIAQVPAEKIAVVSRRLYGQTPAEKFAETTGAKPMTSRFVPGTFTNSRSKEFFEPKLVIATEPESDSQAIEEASKIKAMVIALCSTNNSTKNIDLVIPANNKGRKSLALVYWLLAREVLKAKGLLASDEQFSRSIEEFEYKLSEAEKRAEEEGGEERGKRTFQRGGFKNQKQDRRPSRDFRRKSERR
ncbi:MAG: 30S ribosomal protein S2 [Candidatus Diapherotrites archaeon]|uniref:Small ribosomal subunit protein uS2 n=1 Tax=Candidatus Iainarchaeum sp. TaxID=3101447 RepID=A0A7J4KTK9_9ARCH|nr:30S ribosomal protein S2 [Candidatus Diapherotrites archaeon]HIH21274.1 30S ribosomal protein S2 [Candidatus Diapherotrites archaeon]HIH33252.1 30S ribosomal protein S2 [Candidatus Diapherotrites archaeon]